MKSKTRGNQAEQAVAEKMIRAGYCILALNWKTPRCEIDIVAQKDSTVYFTEVKYRSSSAQGDGLDYITPAKMRRLYFSARVWVQHNNWDGDYRILAAAVGSDEQNYIVQEIIEL